jgi:hypothetical protein
MDVPPRDVALIAGATAHIKRLAISNGGLMLSLLEKLSASR